jgi:O-antigen/teichoic acid export membrane protein
MHPPPIRAAGPQHQRTLAATAFSALKWNYAGTVVRMAANFVVGIILARLLGPSPYGQVAVASLVIGLGNLVADVGFGSALVQKDDICSEDIRFAFTAQVLFAVLVVCAIWPITPLIGAFFHQPETVPVMRAMFFIFILQALGQTATSLLKRNLRQKEIQTAQLISYLIGYIGFGIPLAMWGAGVWSLVAAQVIQTLLNTSLVYMNFHHPIAPLLWPKNGHLVRFGGKVVTSNIVNWWITNSDNLFVGRMFGGGDLGLYSRSFTLVNLPEAGIVSTLQAVLFPAYSRTQSRPQLMRNTYLASIALVAMLTLPVFAVIATIPHVVIGGIFGPRWQAAAPVIVPLSLAMPLDSIMCLAGPVLYGIGKVERELWAQMVTAVCMVGIMLVMSRISFIAVGWGVLMIYSLRATLITRAVMRTLDIQWIDIGRAIHVAALVASGTALMVSGADHVILARVGNMGLHLVVDAMLAVLSYGVLLALTFSHWPKETRLFLNQIAQSSRALERVLSILSRASSLKASAARGEQS